MNRPIVLIASLVVLIGAGAFWYFNQSPSSTGPGLAAASAQDSADVDTSGVVDMMLGDPGATVEVIEYASFTCPHCRSFHENTFPQLKADYIDTGKIKFIHREVYFDRFGLWAGMVARCGGEGRYFGIADLVYKQQSDWTAGGDPTLIAENLRKIGRTAGLTNEQLDACLTDSATAEAMVAAYQQNAEKDDINSTPSFVINGTKHGNMSYGDFSAILDGLLAE